MNYIINEQLLEIQYRNHKLSGNYQGCYECHIKPDWLLIYMLDEKKKSVIFIRT